MQRVISIIIQVNIILFVTIKIFTGFFLNKRKNIFVIIPRPLSTHPFSLGYVVRSL